MFTADGADLPGVLDGDVWQRPVDGPVSVALTTAPPVTAVG